VLRPQPGTRLVACEACDQLFRLHTGRDSRPPCCPRCRATLHERKPESLQRSWALLLAAIILLVPANLFPIMTVIYFGQGEPSTIVGGIIELIEEEMVPIALLVFFASIVVPFLKIFGLAGLLVSVQRSSRWRPRDRTRLYRIIEGIGRWSMIDIFMVAILTALVRLNNISSVEPEIGAVAFAAVVIITMLAAMTFDPRLIWDPVDERPGH
jgi:paraquat-inducible protein A